MNMNRQKMFTDTENQTVIFAENIEKYYGEGLNSVRVLNGISLDIHGGESVAIMGPSGAGKSTLLNLFGCIDSLNSGKLIVMDKDVSRLDTETLSSFRNRHIGFVFQQHNLLPEFTALENTIMPLLIRRISFKAAKNEACELLAKFGLDHRITHKPTELSGGECQRIAVARAIIGKPNIILADEPTGSLDSVNSRLLTETMLKLGKEYGITVIIVTHDSNIASMTERTIQMMDGRIA
jgi:lipoprotein-releasing system ATP-binding protein